MNHKLIMRAMRIHAYGGPEQLRYEEMPVPLLKEGHVLVRCNAASVNPIDTKLASGMKRPVMNNESVDLPWIPGSDFSGIVEEVSEEIKDFKKGDAVYGDSPGGGSYAPYVLAQVGQIARKPKTLNDVGSASIPVAAQTAWQALFDHGHLQAGQTVLIHGGSGGVGTFAVQLAHWKKAKVLATGSEEHMDYLRSLGADLAIDYHKDSFESLVHNVDVVVDLVGGETQERSFKVLKPQGHLVSTINAPSLALSEKHNIQALMMTMQPSETILSRLAQLIDSGDIRTEVTKVYALPEAPKAWSEILSHHVHGKIVLEVPL